MRTIIVSLRQFILRYKGTDCIIGDLANDMADSVMSSNIVDYEDIKKHLKSQDACDGCIKALEEANRRYKSENQRMNLCGHEKMADTLEKLRIDLKKVAKSLLKNDYPEESKTIITAFDCIAETRNSLDNNIVKDCPEEAIDKLNLCYYKGDYIV